MSSTSPNHMPFDHPDFAGGTEVQFKDIERVLNGPVQKTPYVEAYLANNGMHKVDTEDGGMRVNPACGSTHSFTCNYCGKNLLKIRKCAACGVVGYCDRDCQKAGWKAHKPICLQMRKNNKDAGPEAEAKAMSMTSTEKLSKWLNMVPGFANNIREHAKKSPYQGDQVPLFLVQGGTNPFVCCIKEVTGKERDWLLKSMPEMRHHSRPLSQFEKERNAAMGTRTIAYSVCRPPDACCIRGRV